MKFSIGKMDRPKYFKCPITKKYIENPVVDGRRTICSKSGKLGKFPNFLAKKIIETYPNVEELICPITLEPIDTPYILSDGHTYSTAIYSWLSSHDTSPITREKVNREIFINNFVALYMGLFHIYVRSMFGKIITLKVKSTNNIEHVKKLIWIQEGIPIDQQRIVFMGKQLEDDKTLEQYNIRKDTTLHLILRLRGD